MKNNEIDEIGFLLKELDRKDYIINTYIKAGCNRDKIRVSNALAICCWQPELNRLLEENVALRYSYYELKNKGIELIQLKTHYSLTDEDAKKINNSNGIIISTQVFGDLYYRYAFIPNK
jgi:hypothetical protein